MISYIHSWYGGGEGGGGEVNLRTAPSRRWAHLITCKLRAWAKSEERCTVEASSAAVLLKLS